METVTCSVAIKHYIYPLLLQRVYQQNYIDFILHLSHRYGRRPTILLMILLEVPLAIGAAFSGSYGAYTALRVAGGLFFPALYQLPFILALEIMPPKRRTYTGEKIYSNTVINKFMDDRR